MLQKLKPLRAAQVLREKKLYLFTPLEFKRVFGVSSFATSWFLKTYAKKGLFVKLRNGLYGLADHLPTHFAIANRIYMPSYVSLDTALSFHHLIPETIYSVTSVTTKVTREFKAIGVSFTYKRIQKKSYTGYRPLQYLGETVLMAEPEKALADYLYFVDLGKRQLHYERLDLAHIQRAKLLYYVSLFQRPSMRKLVKQIYDEFRKPQRIY